AAGKRSYVAGVQFSRDGRCLYVGCGNGALVTWDMRTGEEHKRLQGAPCELRFLAFNLDGTRLAYAAFGSGVHLSDLATGRELPARRGPFSVRSLAFTPDGHYLVAAPGAMVHVLDGRPWPDPPPAKPQ